jgi:hypothetical protein
VSVPGSRSPGVDFNSGLPDVGHLVPTVVIDTNVMLDIYSPNHLMDAYEKLGVDEPDDPFLVYRRARAREALLLAIHLHRAEIVSYSLLDENAEKLLEFAPSNKLGDFPTHFVIVMIHYVRDRILKGWESIGPFKDPDAPRGDKADDALVRYAQERGIPLITFEEYTPAGVVEKNKKGIRAKAKAAGVRVFTPREFYAAQFDEGLAISKFLDELSCLRPQILRDCGTPDAMAQALDYIEGYFEHVLRGWTNDGTRVRVQLPSR